MGLSWDEAVVHALTLPDTELATAYGKPAVKITSNGRGILGPGHEPQDSFVMLIDRDTVEMLLETDPPMAADVDGEVRLLTPIRLRVVPNGVRVMVPDSFDDR